MDAATAHDNGLYFRPYMDNLIKAIEDASRLKVMVGKAES